MIFSAKYKEYDFLDLGSKTGGSVDWGQRKFGGKGLGVEKTKKLVNESRKKGFDAISKNVLKLRFPKDSFRFVSMMDFLEHLQSEQDVIKVLKNSKKWAREFILIHHPSFEDINYLKKHGLKIDWTDGYGHTCPLTIKDFKRIFKELGLNNYEIKQTKLIKDSSDSHILPLSAPHDTHLYDKSLGPKKKIKFDKPVYCRVEIIIKLK
jgi:hypothetical protein